ncbi:hypothetical protein CE91St46_18490 [Eubacteriales bacterium]|nr:zinc-ribbon domain-containing protein [Faecalicatena sp. BF-R-105]GKH50738.1 hypothetical protein CE91St46_18490 [Eubacteriales bacterium]GKH63460.1 hypothetical protein CE91St47_19290 [Eubacteriales bacterium]
MAFCGQCGNQYEDSAKFCPSCGTPNTGRQPSEAAAAQTAQHAYQPPIAPGAPGKTELRDAQENKGMAVLAYLIFLIPLLAAKESKFARYHTNQGLVLFLAAVVYGILFSVLSSILFAVSWRLGLTVTSILGLVGWAFTALAVIGIVHACKGEMKPLPLLGGITILK